MSSVTSTATRLSASTASTTSTTSTSPTPSNPPTPRRPSTQGALFITPISLSALDPADHTCPICQEPYIDCPSPGSFPAFKASSDAGEWPVSIDMVAEWFGPKKCCGHVMGKNCLQIHVTSKGPWKNKCPLCRDVWYHYVAPRRARMEVEVDVDVNVDVPAPRRSARIARMVAEREGAGGAQASMSQRHGVGRRERMRPGRAGFSSRLMAALQVEEGASEIYGSLEEVKERLGLLYGELEA